MFVFWFNTYFLKHGVTLTHPEGGGTIITGKCDHGLLLVLKDSLGYDFTTINS